MAVTDFGSRRFMESAPRQAREYQYQHQAQAQDEYDEEYGWYEDDQPYPEDHPESIGARLGRLTHYLGALVSVVLLIGLVVWGYKLVARDVSGVPVIRAVQGDARTAPDDPGGDLARNGGLSVNEVAAGVSVPPNAEIAIAPAPTGLEEDDVAMGELADPAALDAMAEQVPLSMPERPVIAVADAEAAAGLAAGLIAEEPTDLAALGIVGEGEDATLIGAEMQDESMADAAPAISAPRPAPRPASVAARAQSAPAATEATQTAEAETETPAERPAIEQAVAEAVAEAPPPAQVSSGSPLVQIGAFDSDGIANSEWGRISGRFSSLFSGKSPVVQTTERNGRTFYRLRVAGFESRDDARRFCAALLAEGTDCYPATAQ
ncbi:Sporulation related domain-containing protein [Paracoccus isoporae]|uniref:Sporulation related domain-containing protein n=1 Tax=Paracoccus isoporae TaxID=591205 RepID=A0A1G6WSP1_9RHOB|nr:SPOR domain-containing protein [Paracoccus isoporae]SDD68831.1 Sporulation related domain-containing protein [Paracoccus isoporae]